MSDIVRIVLVQPHKPRTGVAAEEHWQLCRPLGLHALVHALQLHTSCDVRVVDLELPGFRQKTLPEVFAAVGRADLFGVTATTMSRFEAVKVCRCLKELYPNTSVVVGGIHFMHCVDDTLRNVREIDMVVRGEGEVPIVALARALADRRPLTSVEGVSYRGECGIVHNPASPDNPDQDAETSFIAADPEVYPEYLFGVDPPQRAVSIMASRGCPYRCVFCAKASSRYKTRTPKCVVDEMEIVKRTHDIHSFNFLDLSFGASPRYVRELCGEIIGRRLNVKWWCESRADTSPDLIPLMKKAGCVATVVGIESGSPEIVARVSKGISVEQAVSLCRRFHKAGIAVAPYFMYSLPGETLEDARMTQALIERLERFTKSCSFQPCTIYPGTEVERLSRLMGLLPANFSWYDPYESPLSKELGQLTNVPLFVDQMTPEELRDLNSWIVERRTSNFIKQRMYGVWASRMTTWEFLVRGVRSVLHGRPSVRKVVSVQFLRSFFRNKLHLNQ